MLWLAGGEQLGLSSRELELCDDVVTVPMGFRSTGLNCSFDEARNVMDSMSVATSACKLWPGTALFFVLFLEISPLPVRMRVCVYMQLFCGKATRAAGLFVPD